MPHPWGCLRPDWIRPGQSDLVTDLAAGNPACVRVLELDDP